MISCISKTKIIKTSEILSSVLEYKYLQQIQHIIYKSIKANDISK